jgi:kinesin family protein 6/9
MEKNEKIKVFLRLRPTPNNTNHITIVDDKKIEIVVPKTNNDYINNTKERHTYLFEKIFDIETKQIDIFNNIAKDVVDSALDGYNGTIFAYGQTGSGKTYTITGEPETLEKRGIIPRTISYIFNEIKKKPLYKWTVYISYLEIYNNDGYDLLNDTGARNLEDLPKVILRENRSKQFVLYNLSTHKVEHEEEALYWLNIGDDNRVVAETPKNDASTRSHCIFMFQIESQKEGEDTKTVSKLHVVDLSGSESKFY